MSRDKYISKKQFVSGFSFANLGLFSGFGNGIIGAVYALVLMDIFNNSVIVGIYFAIYSFFCMLISLFADEFFKSVSKSKLFYISMISIAIIYFMMAFPVQPATFISLDFLSGIPLTLVGLLIPLFMSDFSKDVGINRLNGRYSFWVYVGAFFSPIIAMFIASNFGNRSAFFAVAFIYFFGALLFHHFGIVQKDKKPRVIRPKKTIKQIIDTTVSYFTNKKLSRAYIINLGFDFQSAIRMLYVPIIIMEQGFSKEILGIVLMLGIIPYALLVQPLSAASKKYGINTLLSIGFLSFAAFSIWAAFASGYTLLVIFVLWQISGAIISSVKDLLFFDYTTKLEQSKYIGIFKTTDDLTKIIAPLIGAGIIYLCGITSIVWIITAVMSIVSVLFLYRKSE